MDVRVHTDVAEFGRLAESWNDLLSRSENSSIFSRHEYLAAWLKYFGGDHRPFVVEVCDGGEVVGYAPLLAWHGEDPHRLELCAIGRFADYCDLVVEPGYEERVASALFDLLVERGAASLTLDHFREETRVTRALVDVMRQRGILFQPMAVTRAPHVRIDGSWGDFIRGRSRNTYRDVRKKLNRLAGTPGLEVEEISDPARYSEHVRRMLDMHLKLWFTRGVGTPYKVRERRLFLEEVGRTMLDRGLLRFTCLSLEGQAAAYLWCYDHKGVRHYLNAAWDTAHASLSPGSLLLINDMRDAFDRGMAEYDMLGGEESYKYRYATGRHHVTTLVMDGMDRPRRTFHPLRSGVTDSGRRNLLVTAHPDDEAIFFGTLLRSEPETKWTHCLVTAPSPSPLIRDQRLAEFQRSCTLLGMEPVFLDLEEPPRGAPLEPADISGPLAEALAGRRFDAVYTHGAFGEYGHPHHAAVSLATHETFENTWSLAGPLEPEQILGEVPGQDFPGKLDYFRDVHHSQLYLSELVAPGERYLRLPLDQARLIHRLFFQRSAGGEREPMLHEKELGQARALFDRLFDAYFSRSRLPAELAGAAGSTRIDVISSIQLRILSTALSLAGDRGRAVEGFAGRLAGAMDRVTPRAADAARKLVSLSDWAV